MSDFIISSADPVQSQHCLQEGLHLHFIENINELHSFLAHSFSAESSLKHVWKFKKKKTKQEIS